MGKLESLIQLDSLGLNTPELLLEIPRWKDDRMGRWEDFYSKVSGRVSIRTERDGEHTCPFLPNITLKRAAQSIPKLVREDYRILIFRAIDPKNSLHAGNIAFPRNKPCVIEWVNGAGTPRDIERKPHHMVELVKGMANIPPKIYNIYMTIMAWIPDPDDKIFEWSIYPYPVGKRQEHQIFWEIRPWQ